MNLFEPTSNKFNYHRPVQSVAMHPDYRSTPSLASGGLAQQFIVNSKGWFGFKDTVLHAGEGPIHAVRWKGTLIAWANDVGVKLYDNSTGTHNHIVARITSRASSHNQCVLAPVLVAPQVSDWRGSSAHAVHHHLIYTASRYVGKTTRYACRARTLSLSWLK
jgi:hypothetical protein